MQSRSHPTRQAVAPTGPTPRAAEPPCPSQAPTNETIADGWGCFPDTAYWAISTAFGGADKRAETFAGRFVFAGHCFFCMIILATYTGSLGAYLSSAYTVPTLNTYSDLVDGDYSVAVVGPRWNDSDPASPYSGQYMGGNGVAGSSGQVPDGPAKPDCQALRR